MYSSIAEKLRPTMLKMEFDGTATPVKTALFLLVCIGWLLPGLVGHDPWKFDEAVMVALVQHMLHTGDWVVPHLAGEAYAAKAPLYPMVAALFAKVTAGLLPLHDGARLASGFFLAVTMVCLALSAVALFGPRFGRLSVLLLIGSLGLLVRSHEMSPEVAVLAAFSVALLGLVQSARHPRLGGIVFGTGVGAAFLANGLAPVITLLATAMALPLCGSAWRSKGMFYFAQLALLAALPWLFAWPAALAREAPLLASAFWDQQIAGSLRCTGTGPQCDPSYFTTNLLWYAWPSLPIATAGLWTAGRGALLRPELRLPLVALIGFLIGLSVLAEPKESTAMPLLLPLALLAAGVIDQLRRGAASWLDWFGIMTFGLFIALLWLGWLAALIGWSEGIGLWLQREVPGATVRFALGPFLLCALLSAIWIAVVAHARRTNRRAIVNWSSGITLFWIIAMALWLPTIDHSRSYRSAFVALQRALPNEYNCIAARDVGEAQRALLDYLVAVRTVASENVRENSCSLLLVQAPRETSVLTPGSWRKLWEGSRPNDKREVFRLYRRTRN